MIHKTLSILLILTILSLLFLPPVLAAPSVSAQAALVMEASSGRVLYQKNADAKLPMASTTKIMTAIVALEQGNLKKKIKISSTAAAVEGSSMYLEAGEIMTLEELLYGLMLSSGNDAAVAIAEYFGGVEKFVGLMNQKGIELGATNTHFQNPNGLPQDNHYSTAYDMALMTAYGLANSDFATIVATKTYSIAGEDKAYPRTLTNHNKLLRMYQGCVGVKTGYTKAAGRCLVSAATRDGMTLICVTLNAPNDWNDHTNLFDYAFSTYHLSPILSAGTPLGIIPVEKSETTALPLTVAEDVLYPLSETEHYTTDISIASPLIAPIADGTQGGTATICLEGSPVMTVPLVTTESAARQSVFSTSDGSILRRVLNFLGSFLGLSFP